VSAYLDALARDFENTFRDGAGTSKASVRGLAQLGRVEDVSGVLGLELSVLQSDCVLALAALRVYYDVPGAFRVVGKERQTPHGRGRAEDVLCVFLSLSLFLSLFSLELLRVAD